MGAEALLESEGAIVTQILEVETTLEGTVEFRSVGNEAGGFDESGGSGSPDQCEDDASNLDVFKEYDTLNWYFKRDSWPLEQSGGPDLTRDQVEAELRDAVNNITHINNICGAGDTVSATASYQGNTDQAAEISASAVCQDDLNSTNVVGFGDLPSNYYGYSCWEWQGHDGPEDLTAFDSRLNRVDKNWTDNGFSSSCAGDHDIEGAMTHEFGHVFGLAHVSESNHEHLTMSQSASPCAESASQKTLGWGDYKGLRARY